MAMLNNQRVYIHYTYSMGFSPIPQTLTPPFFSSQICGFIPYIHHGCWVVFNIMGKGLVPYLHHKFDIIPILAGASSSLSPNF